MPSIDIGINGSYFMSNNTGLTRQNRENEVLLIDMARYLLNRKKLIIFITFAAMLLVSVKVLLEPNQYSSSASLLPTGNSSNVNELGKLAGFINGNISDENSSELYPVILSSRLIQEAILTKRYEFTNQGRSMVLSLPEYFETDNPDQQRQSLSSITKIKTDQNTGCIYLAVETEYPGLSQAVLSAYLFELENYNLFKRNSQGKRNAVYLANQIREIKDELTASENRLESYRLANQNWSNSTDPTILKEARRLGREVEFLSHRYLNLIDQHEIARQETQNDLPIVAVLDQSSLPTVKSGPFRTITVLLFGTAAFFITVFVLLAKAVYHYKTEVENNIYYKSLSDDINKTVSDTKQIFRIIKKSTKKELTATDA